MFISYDLQGNIFPVIILNFITIHIDYMIANVVLNSLVTAPCKIKAGLR